MEYLNIPSLTCRSKQALSKQQKAAHSYQCPLLHFSHTAFKPSQPHTKTHTSHTPAPGRSGAWARVSGIPSSPASGIPPALLQEARGSA
eukprot:scaffold317905_cov15-Tisochrysis_lutea.AAC.1